MTPEQAVVFVSLAVMALMIFFAARAVRVDSSQIDEKLKKSKGIVYGFRELEWSILLSNEMQSYLPDNKLEAIKLYQEVTGATFKESKEAIDYFIKHPDDAPTHLRHNDDVEGRISIMRELLRQGKRAEARVMYQALTGVDQLELRSALDQLEEEARIEQERFNHLRDIVDEDDGDYEPAQSVRREQKG
jgi:ribosomal protein L7/L12